MCGIATMVQWVKVDWSKYGLLALKKYYSDQLLVTSSGAGGGRVSLVTTLNLLKIASRSVPEKTLKGKSK